MKQAAVAATIRGYLAEHKYSVIAPPKKCPGLTLLMRRRGLLGGQSTFAVFQTEQATVTIDEVKRIRKALAFHVGFIPMLYELGINLVLVGPNLDVGVTTDPKQFVAKVNTFWAMIQSVYVLNETSREGLWTSSWGQVVSGRIQEQVAAVISTTYELTRSGE